MTSGYFMYGYVDTVNITSVFTVSVHLVSKNTLMSLQRGSDEEITLEKQHGGR